MGLWEEEVDSRANRDEQTRSDGIKDSERAYSAADSFELANMEIVLRFTLREVVELKHHSHKWVYENNM